ncbi:hypothetical protein ACW7G0_14210, partial [Lysobacter sp. A286]
RLNSGVRALMTVDRQARKKLAESTRWLVGARITNYQFDDAIPKSEDPAIREIYGQFLWLLYGDLREHRLSRPDKLSSQHRETAARCILFLKSNLAYPWPVLSRTRTALLTLGNLLTLGMAGRIYFRRVSSAGDMSYWPFLSESQYIGALRSPAYLSGGGL